MVADDSAATTTAAATSSGIDDQQRPTHIRFDFSAPDNYAIVELLWDKAPRTCAAVVKQFPCTVMSCHARNSGGEALYLTPECIKDDFGDENANLEYELGDVCFGYEPKVLQTGKGICEHAHEDASEVAWIYHPAALPRRWVSVNGDPTNQTPPWKTTDVALNKWGRVVHEEGFYSRCSRMPRSGEQEMKIGFCDKEGKGV